MEGYRKQACSSACSQNEQANFAARRYAEPPELLLHKSLRGFGSRPISVMKNDPPKGESIFMAEHVGPVRSATKTLT